MDNSSEQRAPDESSVPESKSRTERHRGRLAGRQDRVLHGSLPRVDALRTPACFRLLRAAIKDEGAPEVEITRGKAVWEVSPLGFKDKSDTVRRLMASQPAETLPVVAGDDTADEPAFAAVPEGVTVRVGFSRTTSAKYYVRTPKDIWDFLKRIEEIRS